MIFKYQENVQPMAISSFGKVPEGWIYYLAKLHINPF